MRFLVRLFNAAQFLRRGPGHQPERNGAKPRRNRVEHSQHSWSCRQRSAPGDIALTPGAPNATGEDIVVTDLSTDGSSSPLEDVSLSVAALGPFQPATDTCALGAGPVSFVLPVSGQATTDICAFSVSGLDPSYTYTLTGPSPNDMSVVGEAPLGLGIVDLTIQLSSTTASGARTLFIQNASLDTAAATGVIDVQ